MRKFTYLLITVLALTLIVIPSNGFAAKKGKPKPYKISAQAVIFSDSTRVKRLYGNNVHKKALPASTVKIMTALLVLEQLPLHTIVKVSKNATRPQPSKIHVKPGERYKASDLLYAILLNSANDATVVLAEAVAGSHWKFVNLMNKRARQLGCRNTHFANAHGLPTKEPQYTTAYDMYLIFRAALRHRFFRTAIRKKYKTIRSRGGRKIRLKSHNKILWNDWRRKLYGKTGWTKKAGACFVGYLKKGKNTLIIAIFGCSRRWNDIKYIVTKYGGIKL